MGDSTSFCTMRHMGALALRRRQSLPAGAAAAAGATAGAPGRSPGGTARRDQDELSQEVITTFVRLPGQQALKLWAPADGGRLPWVAEVNPDQQRFVASTFKAYVLAAYLRAAEDAIDPQRDVAVAEQLTAEMDRTLTLDERVYSSVPRSSTPRTSPAWSRRAPRWRR